MEPAVAADGPLEPDLRVGQQSEAFFSSQGFEDVRFWAT
jgi:hypothetical protein